MSKKTNLKVYSTNFHSTFLLTSIDDDTKLVGKEVDSE
jgi:hypothetical protein